MDQTHLFAAVRTAVLLYHTVVWAFGGWVGRGRFVFVSARVFSRLWEVTLFFYLVLCCSI